MNKAKYLFIGTVVALSLVLWGAHPFAQANEMQGKFVGSDIGVRDFIGYRVYDPVYLGNLGQVSDVLVDRCDGRVAFVLVSNTPDFGWDYLAVPFPALDRTGEHTFQVNFSGISNIPVEEEGLDMKGARFARFLSDHRSTVGLSSIPATIDLAWADGVYRFYGFTPFFTAGAGSQPEIVSYTMSGRTDDFAIHFPDGTLVALMASAGVAPYWTSCGMACGSSDAMSSAMEPPLPADAMAGQCYALVWVPPRCETVSEQVMTRPASERIEQIPAKYETVEEQVMVRAAYTKTEEIPAEYQTVQEQVLVEAAHTEWRPGRGAVEKVDHATGKIMCLVEIPANYKTVEKQVLVKPASTREIEIPAQYETRQVQRMVEPAHENHIQIPAEYQTVTRTQQVADGYYEWQKVEGCQSIEH